MVMITKKDAENYLIKKYVKKHDLRFPTKNEIARSVPPGLQEDARKQKIGNRIWIGKCPVYNCKLHYSENDIKQFIKGVDKNE
tara:strand:+ start:610 stop:858 length:249 start_codon:yes stop_codon:yes gene_type:complete